MVILNAFAVSAKLRWLVLCRSFSISNSSCSFLLFSFISERFCWPANDSPAALGSADN